MNGFDYKKGGKNKKLGLILTLPFVILFITYIVYKLFFTLPPVIEGIEAFNLLPLEKTITLKGKNLKLISIFINQDNKKIELLRDIPEGSEKIYTLQIRPKDLQLKDGSAKVIIKARANILKEVKYEIDSLIDTIPPTLEILKAPFIIHQGSGGFALLRAKGADSVFVKFENHAFKAFKSSSNYSESATTYLVFFPAPFGIKQDSVFYAVAKDIAGNEQIITLPTRLKTRRYKTSSINIDDSFINRIVSPLLNEINISNPVSAFKEVNEKWRKRVVKKLTEIAQKTKSEILWEGCFLQLKNSKVMAKYGDTRIYLYKGRVISESVHLGYDLASVANAAVEAANTGIVVYAGDLGIYGNTIIIDHGLGLMSLYGHLSMIMVEEGQTVKKGEVIGKTGSTGFADGDHLHFGILIHGYEVSPLYWWDPNWIKVNVIDYIEPKKFIADTLLLNRQKR
jgi:murein DD-endopeptidase MepM/ murein hydrolase activator NlpD